MFLKNFWLKFTDRQRYNELKISALLEKDKKIFKNKFEAQINNIKEKIDSQNKDMRLFESFACTYFGEIWTTI